MMKIFFTSIFILMSSCLMAQGYEKEYATLFAYEVKQVDEFIDRFNGADTDFIKYYESHNPGRKLDREHLIKGLFNTESKSWNLTEVNEFIKTVNDVNRKPMLLDFYGDNWYAKVNCAVKWKGQPKTVTLKLKVEKTENGSFKWIVAGVEAPFLESLIVKGDKKGYISFKLPAPRDSTIALSSASSGTDFMDIDRASNDKKNISNYFYKSDTYNDELPLFVNECLNGHLSISQVNTITYCFSQIKGWYFETRQYNRQTKNSGWLIGLLVKTNTIK
jgi:hypothetical protein